MSVNAPSRLHASSRDLLKLLADTDTDTESADAVLRILADRRRMDLSDLAPHAQAELIAARIGDPSGRSSERPQLTDADVRRNLGTYRDQVSPFFDFERAEFRFNSEWLARVTLPELLGVLERLPASAALQRERQDAARRRRDGDIAAGSRAFLRCGRQLLELVPWRR